MNCALVWERVCVRVCPGVCVCCKTTNYCDEISIIVTQLCAPSVCAGVGEYLCGGWSTRWVRGSVALCACMAHLLLSHCKRPSKSSLREHPHATPNSPPKDATHNICCTRTHSWPAATPHSHTYTDARRQQQFALTQPLSRCCALFCNPSVAAAATPQQQWWWWWWHLLPEWFPRAQLQRRPAHFRLARGCLHIQMAARPASSLHVLLAVPSPRDVFWPCPESSPDFFLYPLDYPLYSVSFYLTCSYRLLSPAATNQTRTESRLSTGATMHKGMDPQGEV